LERKRVKRPKNRLFFKPSKFIFTFKTHKPSNKQAYRKDTLKANKRLPFDKMMFAYFLSNDISQTKGALIN